MAVQSRFTFCGLAIALVVGNLVLSTSPTHAQTCNGNGCKDIILEKVNGCMQFRNLGRYPIEVSTGAFGGKPTVYPGTPERYYTLGYDCMKNFLGEYTATLIGAPPPKTPPTQTPPAPLPTPPPREEAQYKFLVQNSCPYQVHLALRYIDAAGNWKTSAWYGLSGSARRQGYKPVEISGRRPITTNAKAYYYAEISGYDYTWSGNNASSRTYEVDGIQRDFISIDATGAEFRIDLDCSNFALGGRSSPSTVQIK